MAPKVARTARKPCGIKLGSKLLGLPSDVDKQLAVPPFPRSAGAVALGNTFSAYGTRHNVATTHHGATTHHTTRCSVHNGCTHAKRSQTSCIGIRSHWKFHTDRAHALAVAHTHPPSSCLPTHCAFLSHSLSDSLSLSLSFVTTLLCACYTAAEAAADDIAERA